ncbi:MAG TPA: 4-(cytidine 5'-diphospho)-2-C-methyl-D-erythritol kinase [Nocardioidaceae bacterium]|nr:4-(cytidine 5'-diphospho)-2-C-methyl-D-erythritol kinase [Nocardioidaceae bacterium]
MNRPPAASPDGSVTVAAPAKVNLCLEVGPVRPDGFHALATVYQAIGLHDLVTVRPSDEVTMTVRADDRLSLHDVPTDGSNIAVRAALLLAEHSGAGRGAHIHIDKSIPVAGGLAGGSADGAATLLACDRLWGLSTPLEELVALAAELGCDVPFALVGGTAIGSGRGESLTPLLPAPQPESCWWVVLESADGLSTPAVYKEFDVLHDGSAVPSPRIPEDLVAALRSGEVAAVGATLSNGLQEPAFRLRPGLRETIELGRSGLPSARVHGALVSGSGPSCLFLCGSRADAVHVAEELTARGLGPVSVAPGPVPGARVVPGRAAGARGR